MKRTWAVRPCASASFWPSARWAWWPCWSSPTAFETEKTYTAEFYTVLGRRIGNFVRIAGVEVGKVRTIQDPRRRYSAGRVRRRRLGGVDRGQPGGHPLPATSSASVTSRSRKAPGGTRRLPAGATIPLARTAPALDLDALLGGFRPLFHALNPDQVNALSEQLVAALQGEGATLTDFLAQTAAVTNTLADRDQLIGDVIANLRTTMGALADQSTQFAGAVDSLAAALATIASRKQDLRNGLALR